MRNSLHGRRVLERGLLLLLGLAGAALIPNVRFTGSSPCSFVRRMSEFLVGIRRFGCECRASFGSFCGSASRRSLLCHGGSFRRGSGLLRDRAQAAEARKECKCE